MLHHRLRAASGARENGGGGGGGGDIPTDYIAFYTMDNISGSTLIDETGNYDGTIYGATQTAGVIGNALSFDGGNDYVPIGAIFNFSGSVDFTFSLWVKTGISNTNNYLFGTDIQRGVYARVDGSNNTLLVKIDDGVNDAFTNGSTIISDNVWHHIILMNQSSVLTGWVDGIKEVDIPHSVGSMLDNLLIGRLVDNNGYFNAYFNGYIDQFRLYDRALTSSEITALYEEGL